ncbi:MAG: hypothetical protein LBN10_03795, partial [Propionibacteriaceae bacterium]|nr:hypothetical protein [Propionibacteriaceae bacterium]
MTVIPPLSLVSPAVWRSPDVLEVPLASGPCLLTGVPTQMKRAVTLLDGYHATDELEELVGPVWARWLVDTLKTRDGFVSTQRPQPLRVDVTGSGLLAHKLKRGLASDDTATSRLVVVACPTWEADRVLTDSLIASRTAHVVVTVTDTLASVGPFWVPGRGSCLRCMDLARRAHDPSWPLAVFQLMQVKARPDTVLASWALATVAAHVRGFSSGHEPESMSSTITMDRSGALTYRAWPLHPACHCSGSADAKQPALSPYPMSSIRA